MKSLERRTWMKLSLAALGAAGLGRLALRASSHSFAEDFTADWELQKAYTLEVAEAMPADKYGYKPTEEIRPFGELMKHIGQSCFFFSATAVGVEPPAEGRFEGEATRERIVPFLRKAFDYSVARAAELDDAKASEEITIFRGQLTMTRAKVCRFMWDHLTHHRGYALPYLRMNGIEPPAYRYTQRNESPM